MAIRVCLLFYAACLVHNLYGVTIVIHGSFASERLWWSAEGSFFSQLEHQAAKMGKAVVPFSWSGRPESSEIIKAGKNLAKLILSYPVQEEIIIIAHSHGGNIVNCASQEIFEQLSALKTAFYDVTLKELLSLVYDRISQKTYEAARTFFSLPHYHIDDLEIVSAIKQDAVYKKKFLIDKVYMLGVPVNYDLFKPSMDIIGNVINFYSLGDLVQPLMGYSGRLFHPHERITNLQIIFRDHNTNYYDPGHSQLHADLVGKWILHIPETLQRAGKGGFDKFAFGRNGNIKFDVVDGPLFEQEKSESSTTINAENSRFKDLN